MSTWKNAMLSVVLMVGCKKSLEHQYVVKVVSTEQCLARVSWMTSSLTLEHNTNGSENVRLEGWGMQKNLGTAQSVDVRVTSSDSRPCAGIGCEIIQDGVSVLVHRETKDVTCEWPVPELPEPY